MIDAICAFVKTLSYPPKGYEVTEMYNGKKHWNTWHSAPDLIMVTCGLEDMDALPGLKK